VKAVDESTNDSATALPVLRWEWVEGIRPILSSLYRVASTAAACLGVPPPLAKSGDTPHIGESLRTRFFFPAALRDWLADWLVTLFSALRGDSPTPVTWAY
jgi:hypothetical protein